MIFRRSIAQDDFGQSYFFQGRAIDLVLTTLPFTAALAGGAILIALCPALPASIASAMRADRLLDRIVLGFCLIFQAAPNFWLALLMLSLMLSI